MSGSSKRILHNFAENIMNASTFSIPVKCGGNTHQIVIDPLTLKATVADHVTPMSRYEALNELGGEAPECHRVCWMFNEMSSSFRDKPENFWIFIKELAEFCLESSKEVAK